MGLASQPLEIQEIKKAAWTKFLHRALFTLQLKMEFGVCKKFGNFSSPIFYFCNLVRIFFVTRPSPKADVFLLAPLDEIQNL